MVEVPRPVFCLTSRSRNRRSSVSLIIANHLSGPRISRDRLVFNRGQQELDRPARPLQRADYVASLPWLPRCTKWEQSSAVVTASTSPRSPCTTRPGEAKASPERGSFVALQRTNRANRRAVSTSLLNRDAVRIFAARDRWGLVPPRDQVPTKTRERRISTRIDIPALCRAMSICRSGTFPC